MMHSIEFTCQPGHQKENHYSLIQKYFKCTFENSHIRIVLTDYCSTILRLITIVVGSLNQLILLAPEEDFEPYWISLIIGYLPKLSFSGFFGWWTWRRYGSASCELWLSFYWRVQQGICLYIHWRNKRLLPHYRILFSPHKRNNFWYLDWEFPSLEGEKSTNLWLGFSLQVHFDV